MARSAAVCGRKRGSPASGVPSDSRKARARSRRIAVSISAWSPRSSAVGEDARPRRRARRRRSAARTRKASSVGPMRVPPSQSSTRAAARASAWSRSRMRSARGDAGQPRAEGEDLGAVGACTAACASLQIVRRVQLHRAGDVDQDQQLARHRSAGGAAAARATSPSALHDFPQRAAQVELAARMRAHGAEGAAARAGRRRACGGRRPGRSSSRCEVAGAQLFGAGRQLAAFLLARPPRSRSSSRAAVVLDAGFLVAVAFDARRIASP